MTTRATILASLTLAALCAGAAAADSASMIPPPAFRHVTYTRHGESAADTSTATETVPRNVTGLDLTGSAPVVSPYASVHNVPGVPSHDAEPQPPPALSLPTQSVALSLSPPAGADRATWLYGVTAGLKAAGRDATFHVENANCHGLNGETWGEMQIPLVDVPCPCAEPAEGRSCYLVKWE